MFVKQPTAGPRDSFDLTRARRVACATPLLLTAVLLASECAAPAPALAAGALFSNVLLPLSTTPIAIAAGDLNGDGNADLAVTTDPGIQIFLSDGNGGFDSGTNFPAGDLPRGLALGDVNRDDAPDLVLVNYWQEIVVLLCTGPGSFAPPVFQPAGFPAGSPALADLNGDDVPDLAVSWADGNVVAVLEGNGNGTFGSPVFYPAGSGPGAIAVGDLDSDNLPDLAVCAAGSGQVAVLLNNGIGGFSPATLFAAGYSPVSIAIGDLNGDTWPDLAVADQNGYRLAVLLNTGSATFAEPSFLPAGGGPRVAVTADLDGDQVLDLAAANTTAEVDLFRGHGDGTFDVKVMAPSTDPVTCMAAARLDGDAVNDLILARSPHSGLTILLGRGTLEYEPRSYPMTPYSAGLAVADLDGTGGPDAVTTDRINGRVLLLPGTGDGSFGSPVTRPSGASVPQAVAAADLNGDGINDLVVSHAANDAGGIGILLGTGGGEFASPDVYPISTSFTAVGDLNHDDIPDLAATWTTSNLVSVMLGNGNGTFGPPTAYPAGLGCHHSVIADMNEDSHPDLVLALGSDRRIGVLLNDGTGRFGTVQRYFVQYNPEYVAVADLNFDRHLDAVSSSYETGAITFVPGTGNGSLGTPVFFPAALGDMGGPLEATDLDGDGKTDVIVSDPLNRALAVLRGRAVGILSSPIYYGMIGTPGSLVITDLNGDSRPDLANSTDGSLGILIGRHTLAAGAEDPRLISRAGALSVCPCPIRSTASVGFELPQSGWTRIGLVDIGGRLVRTLYDAPLGAGRNEIGIRIGATIPAGVYFLRLESAGAGANGMPGVFSRRVVVIR